MKTKMREFIFLSVLLGFGSVGYADNPRDQKAVEIGSVEVLADVLNVNDGEEARWLKRALAEIDQLKKEKTDLLGVIKSLEETVAGLEDKLRKEEIDQFVKSSMAPY